MEKPRGRGDHAVETPNGRISLETLTPPFHISPVDGFIWAPSWASIFGGGHYSVPTFENQFVDPNRLKRTASENRLFFEAVIFRKSILEVGIS
jgi:hypothetical protein